MKLDAVQFKDVVTLISGIAWPALIITTLLIYRKDIRLILNLILTRATKLSAGGLSVDLSADEIRKGVIGSNATSDEKGRQLFRLEVAKNAANSFIRWFISEPVIHARQPSGFICDLTLKEILLAWIAYFGGSEILSRNYETFLLMLEVITGLGLAVTGGAISREEFEAMLKAGDAMRQAVKRMPGGS